MPEAATFDWDEANTGHIARRGVTPEEVEEAFPGRVELHAELRGGETRRLCAGLTLAGRPLQFVYIRRRGRVRVVTAHKAKRKVRDVL